MDLGRYIHQLLKHRNDVYVKGLGVFKRIHTSSVYDDRKGVYLPPVTYLEFDGKSTEGVDFVDFIQQSTQTSRQEADAQVQEAVLNLLESIKENGSVTLNHLGQLIKHGSSLVFKAEDLSGFQLQPIEAGTGVIQEEIPVEEHVLETKDDPIEEDIVPEDEQQEIQTVTEEVVPQELYEEPKSGKSNWYIWAALIAIIVIGGLFYINQNKNLAPVQSVKDSDELVHEDTISDALQPQDTTASLGTPIVDSTAVPEKKIYNPLIPENHTYQIVIGTHNTLAQAYEQAEAFNKSGIESVRVIPSNLAHNKKKVIWDSYETKAEADSALKYVRKHYVSDAWHQKIK